MSGAASTRPSITEVVALLLAATLGFIAIVAPPYLMGTSFREPITVFSVVGEAIEKMQMRVSALLLFCIGLLVGWLSPRRWVLTAMATMIAFPIIAMLEMVNHPTSHNLFPIEFIIYAITTVPAIIGAALSRAARPKSRNGEHKAK